MSGAESRRGAARLLRRTAASVALLPVLVGCTTGETAADERTEAVRQIVREAGVTEDVATCIVDQLEATIGLEVLDDEATSDDQALELNQITTDCLLATPQGSTTSVTAGPPSTSAPPTSAVPATTTIGAAAQPS